MSRRVRVLVADDHPIVLDGVSALVERTPGIKIVGYARTGRDVITLAMVLEPDVVLVDLRLPDMLGSEVVRALRSGSSHTKILLFTGFPNHPGVEAAIASGADGVLIKDATRMDIAHTLRRIVGRPSGTTATPRVALKPRPTRYGACGLTRREYDTLRRLATGETNAEIAAVMRLSPNTVKSYVQTTLQKLGARNRVEAITRAGELGLL